MGRKIAILLFTLTLLAVLGTMGIVYIEGWPVLDAFYFTVITLTTIGYGEIHPLSDSGRLFTLIIIMLGVGNTAYILSLVFQYVLELRFFDQLGRRKMEKELGQINNHTIVCGYGAMGELIATELAKRGKDFVIIDKETDMVPTFKEKGFLYLVGNASDDEILKLAGIEKASTLVCVVTSDAENVFITLSARTLNKDINIISRVFDEGTRPKLLKAGANKIISPYTHASHKIIQTIINPAVDDFLEFVSDENEIDYQLADIYISKDMSCADKTLSQIKLKEQGFVIVGIKRQTGDMVFAPSKDEKILQGDRLLAIGKPENFSEIISNLTSSEA